MREKRFALDLEQTEVARRAGVALNTLQRIERGEWVHAYNLFAVCAVLGLRIEQVVPVRRKSGRSSRTDPSGGQQQE